MRALVRGGTSKSTRLINNLPERHRRALSQIARQSEQAWEENAELVVTKFKFTIQHLLCSWRHQTFIAFT
ncbi:hypothetical protein J6590_023689 [Homalodisca vitripennis]|nr:hypothetical protein J6590_023689 [Homalodisca vitripennis]